MSDESETKTKISTTATNNIGTRLEIFGPPPVIEGEDRAAYEEIRDRFYAAIKPEDFVQEMYVNHVAFQEWDVLRLWRYKTKILQQNSIQAVANFLAKHIGYPVYRKSFEDALEKALRKYPSGRPTKEHAQKLARDCGKNLSEALDEADDVLRSMSTTMEDILDQAQADKAREITEEYRRHKPDAVEMVDRLLAKARLDN